MPSKQKPEICAAVKITAVLRSETCVYLYRWTPARTNSRRRHDLNQVACYCCNRNLAPAAAN